MDRFFLPSDSWVGPVILRGAEAHHCRRVMRKREGDQIEVFDGKGRRGQAVISQIGSQDVALDLIDSSSATPLDPMLEIAVGIPKGKTFDLIIQKAVEMGVACIQPLVTDQGNVRINDQGHESKHEKWQRTALEACKQCGQNYLPEVHPAKELSEWLHQTGREMKLVGALQKGAKPLREYLDTSQRPQSVSMLIGPEGDFSTREYQAIQEAGFLPVHLGDLVLRTETAVFAMVASVRYQFS